MGIDDDRAAQRPRRRRAADPGTGPTGVPGPDPGVPRAGGGAAAPDTRRWGYDPHEDRNARGVGQDQRQFGDDRPEDIADPWGAVDAERGAPGGGGGADLAAGSGGEGDWAASAYGSGQRRGPGAGDAPYRPDPAFGPAAWPGDRSPQQRFGRMPAPEGGPASGPPRGPRGWHRSDETLHDAICERLARSTGLDVADVTVQVRDGCVTLEGTVVDRRMKHAIEDRVDGCAGVCDVDNRIKVMRPEPVAEGDAPPLPHADRPQDSPSARDAALGRFSEPMRGGSGKNG